MPRQIDRPSVGEYRLEVIRPSMVDEPLTIWLASGGTMFGSIGCRATNRDAPSRSLSQTSSGLPTKSSLSSLTSQSRPAAIGLRDRVGVLTDDEVTLLEPHDPLSLEPEGSDPKVAPLLHERLPHLEAVAGRHMDLVAQLAREPDPPHQAVADTGDRPGSHVHVPEGLGRQVDIIHDSAQQITRLRARRC